MSLYTIPSAFDIDGDSADDKSTQAQEWITFGMRLGVSSALHPFEYAKVLIQLGHEPVSPQPGRTLFGRPVMVLPNIFKYVGHIRQADGLSGCFVGLVPKLMGTVVAGFGSERIAKRLGYGEVHSEGRSEDLSDNEFYYTFRRQLSRDIVLHVTALALSQPFHVISVRMMAQYIGKETIYQSVWQSACEIVREEGVFGLFSGLPAKVVGDISCLVLASSSVYVLQKYMLEKRTSPQMSALVNFAWSSIMYPMQVVATCMTVTGSSLAAGKPVYSTWVECYSDLTVLGESKRGSSLFFRYQRPNYRAIR